MDETRIIEAECKVVSERTLDAIAAEIRIIDAHVFQTALEGAVQIGARLKEAKELLGHGNWEGWCKDNLDYTTRQASNFMRIHTDYGDENSAYFALISNRKISSDLSISKALELLKVPEEELEKFTSEVDIEGSTVKELQEEIASYKAAISDWEQNAKTTEQRIVELEQSLEAAQEAKKSAAARLLEVEARLTDGGGSEELEKLKAEKESAATKISELESRLEAAKSDAEAAALKKAEKRIAEAGAKAAEDVRKEYDEKLDKLSKEKDAALAAAGAAEKKAQAMSSEDTVLFKLKVDELQRAYMDVQSVISKKAASDKDTADKWQTALATVINAMIGAHYT